MALTRPQHTPNQFVTRHIRLLEYDGLLGEGHRDRCWQLESEYYRLSNHQPQDLLGLIIIFPTNV